MGLTANSIHVKPADYYSQLREFCTQHALNPYGVYVPPPADSPHKTAVLSRPQRMQDTIIPLIKEAPAAQSALEAETMLRQIIHLSENNAFGGMTVDESVRIYPNELRGLYTLPDGTTLLLAKGHVTLLGLHGEVQIWERDPTQVDPNTPPFKVTKLILDKSSANGQRLNVSL
jgi:hypothetical protein